MKIDKTIKGFRFRYYVSIIPNTMTAKVNDLEICKISDDFKYILLSDNFTEYITDNGYVKVEKLKLNKFQQFEAKEYNGITR